MKIDIEENLIKQNETVIIENEIKDIFDKDEEISIKTDIELLNNLGLDKKMINKVYILLRPENIERAKEYMAELDGIYEHNFISSSNPNEKLLCFIYKKAKNNNLDYLFNDLLVDEEVNNNNLINSNQIVENNENDYEGEVMKK